MTSQLRSLLDGAADSAVPIGLGERAVAGARHRRARRALVGGSVAAVVAAVALVAVVVAGQPFRSDARPQPGDVASLPAELPSPAGLPTLAEAPMDAATTAYVVAGEVILVSSSSRQPARLPLDPARLAGAVGGADVNGEAVSATVSPDGRTVLLMLEPGEESEGTGLVPVVLNVGSGEATVVEGLRGAQPPGDGWLQPQLVAWSPDSSSVACVCAAAADPPEVWLLDVPDLVDGSAAGRWNLPVEGWGLSWGQAGLAIKFDQRGAEWWHVSPGTLQAQGAPMWKRLADDVVALAFAEEDYRHFATADADSIRVWSGYGGAETWLLRGEHLAFLAALPGGFAVVTWPADAQPGEPPAASPLQVRVIDYFGRVSQLTRLPAGTSTASFAADLVAVP